jgi:hypothetical protein
MYIDTYEFQMLHDAFDSSLYVMSQYLRPTQSQCSFSGSRVAASLHCAPRRGGRSHEVPDDTSLPQNPTKAV